MAWIEVHQELRQHPKILRLAARLQIEPATATGYIVNLWLWAIAYSKTGDLTDLSSAEIAVACDYRGPEHEQLLAAMIEVGLIDQRGARKGIHDWKKHGLKFLLGVNERVRKHREKGKLEEDGKRYSRVQVTSTIPNLTIPNPTTEELSRHVVELWNQEAEKHGLARILTATPKRRAAIIARAQEPTFNLGRIFAEIESSPFLRGQNDRGWKADFDFVVCSPNNYLKILEGKYRHGDSRQRPAGQGREIITTGTVRSIADKARAASQLR